MKIKDRIAYLRRISAAYLSGQSSQLTFWHGRPAVSEKISLEKLGPYYMPFKTKAEYDAVVDDQGIPILDYHGSVGKQYNPIAVAQYGLGNYNKTILNGDPASFRKFTQAADWLVENLEINQQGVPVWNHHFDWEYRDTLKAPWYSALSQGQGISCLVRAHQQTGSALYLDTAWKAWESFLVELDQGGVLYRDQEGFSWFEEAVVDPPTHILNGFIWALWGLFDLYIYTGDTDVKRMYDQGLQTLIHYLPCYDTGFWSLYEQAGTRMHMLASPFYHQLHIVQLEVMGILSGEETFQHFRKKWNRYQKNRLFRSYALLYKLIFKVLYY